MRWQRGQAKNWLGNCKRDPLQNFFSSILIFSSHCKIIENFLKRKGGQGQGGQGQGGQGQGGQGQGGQGQGGQGQGGQGQGGQGQGGQGQGGQGQGGQGQGGQGQGGQGQGGQGQAAKAMLQNKTASHFWLAAPSFPPLFIKTLLLKTACFPSSCLSFPR